MIENDKFLLSQIEKECVGTLSMELYKLLYFTRENKVSKFIDSRYSFFNIKKKDAGYVFHYNNRDYYFEILSEKDILDTDRKNLSDSKKRIERFLLRSLRIATTNDLLDQKLLFISSLLGINSVVEYQKEGESKVIDYSSNLIMKKEDYFSLFKAKVINTLDKETLYRYHENIESLDDIDLFYILLAGKEIMDSVSKLLLQKSSFDLLPNSLNDKVIGANCDGIFLSEEDYKENMMDAEIDKFTLDTSLTEHIKKDGDSYYFQKSPLSKKVFFDLFSSYVNNPKVYEELHSEKRYGYCHHNSIACLKSLVKNNCDDAYIVSGKVKFNKSHYIYHSWVELTKDNVTMVIDYNRNLFMKKKDYYAMKDAVIINKTDINTINKLLEYEDLLGLYLPCNLEVYFGKEFIKDFEKNKSLIKK